MTNRARGAALLASAALLCTFTFAPATAQQSISAQADSLDPGFDVRAEQWWLDILSADQVWASHSRGEGVVVAVIDTGVDPSGDLQGAVLPGFSVAGSGSGDVGEPTEYHGTLIATEIAGRGTGQGLTGLAPAATILPVKIPDGVSVDYTAEALTRLSAMDDPPEIASMAYAEAVPCSPKLVEAIRVAIDAGIILVAGMGNDHTGSEPPNAPANCPGVIAVGAYGYFGAKDANTPDLRMWPDSEQQSYTTLAAPGVDILGFEPGTDDAFKFNGTSEATAMTVGSLALVRGAFPDMPSRELVTRVLASARPLDDSGPSQAWGFGSVRPLAAIEDDVPRNAPNPVYDAVDALSTGPSSSPGPTTQDPPTSTTPGSADDVEAASDPSGGVPAVLLVSLGALVLLVVLMVVVVVVVSRRRRNPPPGTGWSA